LIIEHNTYVVASAIILFAATFSALVVRKRIDQLDLVAVLKTRD
jgi:putative ABC transport system permease protein